MEAAGRRPGASRGDAPVARPASAAPAAGTMKLKRQPEDFQVEELPLVAGGDRGRFAFYRLTKRGMGTLEAVEAICRRWNLAGRRVSYGGLKDRHAVTVQYLTILDGPDRPLRESSFDLEPLGRLAHPYGPAHFRGNRFAVVLRDLSAERAGAGRSRAVGELPRDGLPNYFDDQRFGSVGFGGGFIAQAWLAGDHERAFRLAIAEPNPSDRPGTKAEKAILRECWGRWPEAKARLDRSHARSLVTYLVDHPTDFRGAFARVRRELRSLYFSAFQSHLWNLLLGRADRADRPGPTSASRSTSRSPRCRSTAASTPTRPRPWPRCRIPLPASRTPLPARARSARRPREVLGAVRPGLGGPPGQAPQGRLLLEGHPPRPLLRRGPAPRAPATTSSTPAGKKLRLAFELPKGAYATLVVKRVTDAAADRRDLESRSDRCSTSSTKTTTAWP